MRAKLILTCIVLLCGCKSVPEGSPTIIKGMDFGLETVWKAICSATQAKGFELKELNKDDRTITTYYKILPETDVTDPMVRSYKALIGLVPNEAPTGVKYDIEIRVGLYEKRKSPSTDPQENWNFVKWDKDIEQQLVAEFHNRTAKEQRIKQGLEEPGKRSGKEF